MTNLDIENEKSINTYGEDIVNRISEMISSLNIKLYIKNKVSDEEYKELKTMRYDLIFLIRSAQKEVLGDEVNLINLIEAKEKLSLLKEKNNNISILKSRINYLYHVLAKLNSKLALYASHVDYTKKIKRSIQN